MTQNRTTSLVNGIHIGRNDLVTLTAVVTITVFSLLFPYAVFSSESRAIIIAPFPVDGLSGTPVYVLSPLAAAPSYYDDSALASVIRTYGYVFILLTQAMGILHMFVGSGRARPIRGLLLSLVLSAIWICLCQVVYGSPLQPPVSDHGNPFVVFPTTYLVQYPFVPLFSSLFMLAYRENLQAKQ